MSRRVWWSIGRMVGEKKQGKFEGNREGKIARRGKDFGEVVISKLAEISNFENIYN